MKDDILVELSSPIEYAYKGDMQEGSFITLKAPTSKNLTECSFLKQSFVRAVAEQQDDSEEKSGSGEELTGDQIIMTMMASEKVDIGKVLLMARELFVKVGLIEGEEKLTKPLMDKISNDDLEKMTGEYMINFIIASMLLKPKTS